MLRTKFLPGALHAVEGARISSLLLHRLRTAFVSAVWSRKMPLAHVGAVLTLLDGPSGCDPGFFVVWSRFRLLRRYLAYRPMEVPRIYALLGLAADGCPGHGPLHLVVESAGVVGLSWDAVGSVWCRPGLPGLSLLAGPYQHFKAAIGTLGGPRSALICVKGRDSGGAHCWTLLAPFNSYMPHM